MARRALIAGFRSPGLRLPQTGQIGQGKIKGSMAWLSMAVDDCPRNSNFRNGLAAFQQSSGKNRVPWTIDGRLTDDRRTASSANWANWADRAPKFANWAGRYICGRFWGSRWHDPPSLENPRPDLPSLRPVCGTDWADRGWQIEAGRDRTDPKLGKLGRSGQIEAGRIRNWADQNS